MNAPKGTIRTLVAALAFAGAAFVADAGGVDLTIDRVQQRYPWNGLVDIDYTIVYAAGATVGPDDNLEVMMVDKSGTTAVTNRAITFLQAPLPLTEGRHRITWDAHADGVSNRTDAAEFIVGVVHYSAVYMVIDVSTGSGDDAVYHVDFLNGAPQKGFNTPEYKDGKIVLRRIHPGSYVAGAAPNEKRIFPQGVDINTREKQHRVALSRPFYIGLFEITQEQYSHVMGGNPSQNKGQYHPVEMVTYNGVRGGDWPKVAAPADGTFMDKLLKRCKSKDPATGLYTVAVDGFDLPSEFQWEYACRAGSTKAYDSPIPYDNSSEADLIARLKELGRFVEIGQTSLGHAAVGSYNPNSWGLFDMHGNVDEWCRDLFKSDVASLRQYVDPKGPDTADKDPNGNPCCAVRGGWAGDNYSTCRAAYRHLVWRARTDVSFLGFRLCRTLP